MPDAPALDDDEAARLRFARAWREGGPGYWAWVEARLAGEMPGARCPLDAVERAQARTEEVLRAMRVIVGAKRA